MVRDQDVVGLDVAVHYAVAVGVRQRVHDVAQQAHALADRLLSLTGELGAERLPSTSGMVKKSSSSAWPAASRGTT